jgi:hypothetical protein
MTFLNKTNIQFINVLVEIMSGINTLLEVCAGIAPPMKSSPATIGHRYILSLPWQ